MSNTKYINREKLHQKFPQVATILDSIHENNSQNNYWFFVNYVGKYKGKNGKPRTVSMSAIIDVLEQHGYDVDLLVTPKMLINKP
jgi:hypothetical protein